MYIFIGYFVYNKKRLYYPPWVGMNPVIKMAWNEIDEIVIEMKFAAKQRWNK